jgi:GTP-binding protein Era
MSSLHSGFVSGFVSILGRPNAGKSTLLNALVGSKVAIVADKPQTTRTAIQGVYTTPEAQIVFIDTPGIHKGDSPIQKRMMESVRASLDERDLLLYLIDATDKPREADKEAVSVLRHSNSPAFLIVNKIDLLDNREQMLPAIEFFRELHQWEDVLPVSALASEDVDRLRALITARLPEGPPYFPADHVTDQPARFIAAELVREKILLETHQEVPHSVVVLVDQWDESDRLIRIFATIYVERDGQKAIILGSRGAMIKKIGTAAREEMEKLFGIRIYLDLHIKVQANWREKPVFLNALDWRTMAGNDD